MKKYDNCLIYFDTNAFEDRSLGKYLLLSEIRASRLYYDVCSMIDELGLANCVQLCIPDIVWREVKQHMKNNFNSVTSALKNATQEAKKYLGDILDISYELKGINDYENYQQYIEQIAAEFLNNTKNKAKIIDCPMDEQMFRGVIDSAIVGRPPFGKIKDGKEYTDAGFKDVLIWETIKRSDPNKLILFITNDKDFHDVACENICIYSRSIDVKKILIERMNVTADVWFNCMLLDKESYLLHQILTESGFCQYGSANIDSVLSSKFGDDEQTNKTLTVICNMKIDMTSYKFTIVYDTNANELVSADYDEYMD